MSDDVEHPHSGVVLCVSNDGLHPVIFANAEQELALIGMRDPLG
jgi:hypothetical protein